MLCWRNPTTEEQCLITNPGVEIYDGGLSRILSEHVEEILHNQIEALKKRDKNIVWLQRIAGNVGAKGTDPFNVNVGACFIICNEAGYLPLGFIFKNDCRAVGLPHKSKVIANERMPDISARKVSN